VATPADVEMVTEQLGRAPLAEFDVVVRRADGHPVVIRNAPFLIDGRPMPTRYWLVDTALVTSVSRLESHGGVRAAEAAVDAQELIAAHHAYEHERNGAIAPGTPRPRPSGGVGGTREGVKCLHAHYAYWLAGGRDPVGEWVGERLAEPPIAGASFDYQIAQSNDARETGVAR
jgi:hypothetical protein